MVNNLVLPICELLSNYLTLFEFEITILSDLIGCLVLYYFDAIHGLVCQTRSIHQRLNCAILPEIKSLDNKD